MIKIVDMYIKFLTYKVQTDGMPINMQKGTCSIPNFLSYLSQIDE